MTATTTQGQSFQPGRPVVIVATLNPTANESGSITVDVEGVRVYNQEVELVAGTESESLTEVPTQPWTSNMSVRFRPSGGGVVQPEREIGTRFEPVRNIGIVGSLTERQLEANSSQLGAIQPTDIPLRWLDSEVNVLAGLGNLAATSRDLAQLSSGALTRVEQFVNEGGQLFLVDSSVGIGAIPSSGPMGFGDVIALDGLVDLASIEPLAAYSSFGQNQEDFGGPSGLAQDLAQDANFQTADSLVLPLILLGFILLGFVAYVLLRRSKHEMAYWLVLPALTILTTGALWGAGRAQRSGLGEAHISVVANFGDYGTSSSSFLLSSSNGGWESIDVPQNWQVQNRLSINGFGETQLSSAERRGNEVGVDLGAGGFGIVAVAETAMVEPSFEFDISGSDGTISGTVTNVSGHDLHEVTITSGAGFDALGTLKAGQSAELDLTNSDQPVLFENRMIGALWNQNNDHVSRGGVLEFLADNPATTRPGSILAMGWTDSLASPVSGVSDGRTGFATARRTTELLDDDDSLSTMVSVSLSGLQTGSPHIEIILPDTDRSITMQSADQVKLWGEDGWVSVSEGPIDPQFIHTNRVWLQVNEQSMFNDQERIIPRFEFGQ